MRVFGWTPGLGGLLALVAAAAGCSSAAAPELELIEADGIEARVASEVVFISMKIVPEVSMEALYEGRVTVDDNGCLRMDADDRHTVVWPKGYGVRAANGELEVVDEAGIGIGRIGGEFRIPGGEVPYLHEGVGFTEADRALAEAYCPGRFWIMTAD